MLKKILTIFLLLSILSACSNSIDENKVEERGLGEVGTQSTTKVEGGFKK